MTRIVPLAVALLTATGALAETPRPVPSIEVAGEASADVAPDVATLSLGVATPRPRALDAAGANAAAVAAVVSTLKAEGVAPADIRTTALTLSAVTGIPKTGAPRAVAYRAENDVAVEIRSIERAGALTAKLIESGANTVQGIAFRIGDEGKLRDGLRGAAAHDARGRAETYAAALGVKLGRVLSIQPEGGGEFSRSTIVAAPAMRSEPVEAGLRTLSERVSVSFEIEPGGTAAP